MIAPISQVVIAANKLIINPEQVKLSCDALGNVAIAKHEKDYDFGK